uniref:Uncharacterized protein n=1 Tax=Nelumbo nucifera TaxID=4432 RepID=A0A822ZF09_NELNU|nr:TPA_asm: hypothetical protein HUJ06_003014 [Nelumbo nucifera]
MNAIILVICFGIALLIGPSGLEYLWVSMFHLLILIACIHVLMLVATSRILLCLIGFTAIYMMRY